MWPHQGSWNTPDFGVTEWIQSKFSPQTPLTKDQGSDLSAALGLTKPQAAPPPTGPTPSPTPTPTRVNPTGGGTAKPSTTTPSVAQPGGAIDQAQQSQEDAAKAAAEARRQAAMRKYQAQVGIAGQAKEQAKGSYDWIVDTIGSNKKDVLEQVALEEKQGVAGYEGQEKKTRSDYDSAKQQILSMYRDLQRDQEKILRGAGLGQSSRSIEAQMKLNNLLGKDLGGVSTNEADSLAMIGNAVSALKERSSQSRVSIEREAQGKLDKAALDYKAQTDSIDANLQLSANEREDAYAQAEVQLATDVANIKTWASGMKLQAEQTNAKLKELVDGFIGDMASTNALLNTDLGTKRTATNSVLNQIGLTPLDAETGAENVSVGVKQKVSQKYNSKTELDNALASGQITPLEYNAQLQTIQLGSPTLASAAPSTPTPSVVTPPQPQDELMRAVFA